MKRFILFLTLFLITPSLHAHEISFEEDRSLPIVYLSVAVPSGSASDPEKTPGLTSFMANLMLRGTGAKTKEHIDLELDTLGAALDVEIRPEALIFRASVISKNLDAFLNLMKNILSDPSFPEKEIDKLKSETTSEILNDLGNDRSLGARQFVKSLFGDHPFGRPVGGTANSIKNINKTMLMQHHSFLIKERALIIIGTGDTNSSTIKKWASTLAINLNKEPLSTLNAPQFKNKKTLILVDKPDRTQTWIFAGQRGLLMSDLKYFPLYVGNHAFGGGSFSSRLMVEIRVKRGWSYGAYSGFRFGTVPRNWSLTTFPASLYAHLALGHTLKMLEEYKNNGISADEFHFAKTSLVNNSGFNYNTPAKRVENTLLEKTLKLPEGFIESYAERIQNTDLKTINAAIKDFTQPDALTIVVVCTAKDLKSKLAQAAGVPESEVVVIPYQNVE